MSTQTLTTVLFLAVVALTVGITVWASRQTSGAADYYAAEKRYPKSLQELVPKYIRTIPKDPITGSDTTWRVTTEETVQPNNDFVSGAAAPNTEKYIVDVHSGASGKDANGVRFADY